ncbi:glucose-1-phosphate cytidylyltransferase [Paenibacillus crassostreae]|uniref:Glucose-1-phosphate cytidylyltransferase n=1 Tax=Paenibacillus crassostreae TaxID=1763538 RepID=A0A167D8N7_9BACL|nr:glucose-1-phosphate cytidylyltransferase [Paenibacillus crassostreae]AOZ93251.1 glucose-1-phosphate cytidylyltransferase [Paenibacillus crassostreae]OAB74074.1 glucose-1-phosphate cytidylyltransferase [Paenibacillus crassostreae]
MKVVILAGGYGTRISEESHLKPKPMIEIGDKPILWHIMKNYSYYGYNDFVICLGYKGYIIKEFFADYYLHASDVTFDFANENLFTIHNNVSEPWRVTLVDTGLDTMTGGRIKRIKKYVSDERFMLTYGDGVSDINISDLENYHIQKGGFVTMTAIQPGGRFGVLDIEEGTNRVERFAEKSKEDGGWINGGFMVIEPDIFDYIDDDNTVFESNTLTKVANEGKLDAYKHYGFWQCMDTQRDKGILENLWRAGNAPWKIW